MRAIIQRVKSASVVVNDEAAGAIDHGFLVFLGVQQGDTEEELDWLCRKIPQIRCFEDDAGKMNRSLKDAGGNILLISQFTLFGNLKKGSRPSFNRAAEPESATAWYEAAMERLSAEMGKQVASGVFAADMQIQSHLDGPVTLFLDTRDKSL